MSAAIRKKSSSFRLSTGSMKSGRKKRVRRAVSFARDVFLLSAIRDETLDEINRVLLEMEADQELDLDAVLVGGRSALHQAVLANRGEAVSMFLDRGAYVDVLDDDGWTPLHYAVDAGQCDTANLLVSRGADPRHPTLDGNNYLPMDIAMDQCDSDMMALLTDGINQMQQRPVPVVSVTGEDGKTKLRPRRLAVTTSPRLGFDDEVSGDNMDYESVNSDYDNRSIASANSQQLFVPSHKSSAPISGPLRSLRRFRERVRRPSPSPTPQRDLDGNTSEDNSFCTVNEFITDLFASALRGAGSGSLSSVTTADDSQDSLASFPNSSDSPQSFFLSADHTNAIQPVRSNSPANESKTSSSSMLSDDSMSCMRRGSSKRSLQSAGRYNSNGSLVSCDQPVVAMSSASPLSSGIQVCSSGSLGTAHSTPRRIPRSIPIRTHGCSSDDGQCVSPSYDVPRSGMPRKYQPVATLHGLEIAQLGSSFDYDVPHSALRQPTLPSSLMQHSPEVEDSHRVCLEDSGTFVSATDASFPKQLSRESTLLAEDSLCVGEEEHSQITPQASLACDSPVLEVPETNDVAEEGVPDVPEITVQLDASERLQAGEQFNMDLLEEVAVDSTENVNHNPSANTLDASDKTLGVPSNSSMPRFTPEFQLTSASKIKDSFTSVQSLPNFRRFSSDRSTSCSSQEPRSPLTPDSADSDEFHLRQYEASPHGPGYSSATLPWRGRHGSKRPTLAHVMPICSEESHKPTAENRLSTATEFLLSLPSSGPPTTVKEEDEEVEGEEGEEVMTLMDFLSSNDPPERPSTPDDAKVEAGLSVEDVLMATESAPATAAPPVVTRARSDDHSRAPRPVSFASDWMAPVGSESLPSHVATLPRNFAVPEDDFKRNAANRGSFRRLINKASRSTKKSCPSVEVPVSGDGTSQPPKKRTPSNGSGENLAPERCSTPDDTSVPAKKSFMRRTASFRSSFRSKKSKKLRTSVEAEEEQVTDNARANGTAVRIRRGSSNSDVQSGKQVESEPVSKRSNRVSAVMTVAMTAL